MGTLSKLEDSFDVPMLPPRPPDDDPNADFLVRCIWNRDNALEELYIRRRAKKEIVSVTPESKDNKSFQLLKGKEINQRRNPSGIIWKIKTDIVDADERSYKTRNGSYKLYITWDINKQLQEMQMSRCKSKTRIVMPPIMKKTYVLMDIFKTNYEITRDGRGFLKQLTLALGPKSGRFGPLVAPAHVIRYRNLVFRWGPNGEVTGSIVTTHGNNTPGERPVEEESAPEPLENCDIIVMEPPPRFDPDDPVDYGVPNHRKLMERRRFRKGNPNEHPNQRRLCTYPITGAPCHITVDDGDFYLDFDEDSNPPKSEMNMWPYLKPKYKSTEWLARKTAYENGEVDYKDYDAFVFNEEYFNELKKTAEKNIALMKERRNPQKKQQPKQCKVPLDRVRNYYYLE